MKLIKQYNSDGTVNAVRDNDDCIQLLNTFVVESGFAETVESAAKMLSGDSDRFELTDGEYLMRDGDDDDTLTPEQIQVISAQLGTEELYVEAVQFHMAEGESFEDAIQAIKKANADHDEDDSPTCECGHPESEHIPIQDGPDAGKSGECGHIPHGGHGGCNDRCKRFVPEDQGDEHDSSGPDNDARAGWAEVALMAFSDATGSDMPEDAVSDMLCDLAHWCQRNDTTLLAELNRAKMHYTAEAPKGKQFDDVITSDCSEAGSVEAELRAAKDFGMTEAGNGLWRDEDAGDLYRFNRKTGFMEEVA